MIRSIARVIVGGVVPVASVDAILIFAILVSGNRWNAWEAVAGSIVGVSVIFMLAPSILIALVAEFAVRGAVSPKLFLGFGAAAGAIFGSGVAAISGHLAVTLIIWPALGAFAGISGAYCMLKLEAPEPVNK